MVGKQKKVGVYLRVSKGDQTSDNQRLELERVAEQRSHLRADRFPKRTVLVAILERRVRLEVAQQRGIPVEDWSRRRAHIGRVQVDETILERKLRPDEVPVRLLGALTSRRPDRSRSPKGRRECNPARRQWR